LSISSGPPVNTSAIKSAREDNEAVENLISNKSLNQLKILLLIFLKIIPNEYALLLID
jgi:hypothetical protein